MTTRQWKLYNLCKENPNMWFSPEEVCERIEEYTYNEKAYDKCQQIREDVKDILTSLNTDHILVIKNRCVRLGTRDDIVSARQYFLKKIIKNVILVKAYDYRLSHEGFGKLISNTGNPIDEKSKANRFMQMFSDLEFAELEDGLDEVEKKLMEELLGDLDNENNN